MAGIPSREQDLNLISQDADDTFSVDAGGDVQQSMEYIIPNASCTSKFEQRHSSHNSSKSKAESGAERPSGSTHHHSQQKARKEKHAINVYDPNFYKLPVAERSRLLRAQRNREAAHRSRAKNKVKQALLEEETRRQLQLNRELESLLDYLLSSLAPSSNARAPDGSLGTQGNV